MTRPEDERFMREAVAEAQAGLEEGEVAIGAVAVCDGRIVGRGHNRRIALSDITAHAEMMCLRDLGARPPGERPGVDDIFDLRAVSIYSTLEPCAMCSGAIIHYRVGRVVYGEADLLLGAAGSAMDILRRQGVDTVGGVLREECRAPLLAFFERENGRPSFRWRDIVLPEK